MTEKPDETLLNVIAGQEWAGGALVRENERLRAEIEQLRARLTAAERVIEVVKARQIGTSGGVGAAMAAYDAAYQT